MVVELEAVLKLRAVHADNDLDTYLDYHHTRELSRRWTPPRRM
jgi:hypothetical protein